MVSGGDYRLEQSRAVFVTTSIEGLVFAIQAIAHESYHCVYCKKIRDDQNYWKRLEEYVSSRSEAQFSHGICPSCFETVKADLEADELPHSHS